MRMRPHVMLRGTIWHWRRRLPVAKRHPMTVWLSISLLTADRPTATVVGAALDTAYGMLMPLRTAAEIDDHTFARAMRAARDITRAEMRERAARVAAERAKTGQVGAIVPRPARQSTVSPPLQPGQLDIAALLDFVARAPDAPTNAEGGLAKVPAALAGQLAAIVASLPVPQPQPLKSHHGVDAAACSAMGRISMLEHSLAISDHEITGDLLPAVLQLLSLNAEGAARHVLGEAVLKGQLEAWRQEHDRLRSVFPSSAELAREASDANSLTLESSTPSPIPPSGPTPPPLPTQSTSAGALTPDLRVSEAFTHYQAAKKVERAWTSDTERDAETAVRLFCELVGDKRLREISRIDALKFRTELSMISSDWGQSKLYRDPTSSNINSRVNARTAVEISKKRPEITKLAPKTINKQTSTLNSLWDWARDNAGCDALPHPFAKLQKKPKGRLRRVAAKAARDAFQISDIQKIFTSKTWTNETPFADDERSALRLGARPSRYFGLLLAAYGGLRLSEIVQLRIGDVVQHDGFATLRIGALDDAKYAGELRNGRHGTITDRNSVKSDAAVRTVPVHPVLIRQGLLRYIELQGGKPADMLFHDVQRATKDRGKNLARFFRELRDELVFGPKKTFHSFRHTVRTMLDSILADKGRVDVLIGHEEARSADHVSAVYNKGLWLRPLFDDLSRLGYGIAAFDEDAALVQRLQRDGFVLATDA